MAVMSRSPGGPQGQSNAVCLCGVFVSSGCPNKAQQAVGFNDRHLPSRFWRSRSQRWPIRLLVRTLPGLQTAPCSQCPHTADRCHLPVALPIGTDPSVGAPPSWPDAFPLGLKASAGDLAGTQTLRPWHVVTLATLWPSQELPLNGCHCVGDCRV